MYTTTMARAIFCLGLAAAPVAAPVAAQDGDTATGLYPGEENVEAAGFPAITYFAAGEADAPLVVFVPGAHHAARVAYGGHEGSDPQDFLATHVVEQGYNFLAVSYPIDLEEGGLETAHPDFMIRDWGEQVVELAGRALEEHDLEGPVIVAGWSMAGKSAQAIHAAAEAADLDLAFFVSLAATPALPGLIAVTREYPMLESGYADRRKDFEGWYQQMAAMGEAQGRQIVPEEVFKTEYQGDIPVNLQGYGQQYRDGAFEMDRLAAMADANPFAFDAFPLVGMVAPTLPADARHALTDKAAWGIYNANTLYKRYAGGVDLSGLSEENWTGLVDLAEGLNDRLTTRVEGNHFFFMGAPGAAATAEAIVRLDEEVRAIKQEAGDLLGTQVN